MKDCLDGRLHQMVAGGKNIDNKPVYGAICVYCGYFIPNIKNYKAEIENEIKEAFADGCAFSDGYDDKIKGTLKERTNKILSLFREIVKESCGDKEVITAFFRRYNEAPKDVEDWLNKCVEPMARNQLRSEILSNVEEVLK